MNVKAGEHRRSELCGLDVTISACYDWPVACLFHYVIGISGILPYKRNVTSQTFLSITRDFFRLDNTRARLYNAAASPALRLRSAGSLAINHLCLKTIFIIIHTEYQMPAILGFLDLLNDFDDGATVKPAILNLATSKNQI